MAIGTYASIITLNVNGLNAPTKRHRLATQTRPIICCLQELHFRAQDTYRLKVREWKNIFHANGKQKKAGVTILISDKTDLKIKKITGDKERHNIMIKGRHSNCKYLCSEHRSTSVHKINTNRHKRRN